MAVDFDPPPIYDPVVEDKLMSNNWQAWQEYSWQTLTSYINKNGFFLPPMTTAQRNELQSPVNGQMFYNTDLNKAQLFEGGAWKTIVTV
jgi:hypothetical protein